MPNNTKISIKGYGKNFAKVTEEHEQYLMAYKRKIPMKIFKEDVEL